MDKAYKTFDEFRQKQPDAASSVSAFLRTVPEYSKYQFDIAYYNESNSSVAVYYAVPGQPNGLILDATYSNSGYAVTQYYPKD